MKEYDVISTYKNMTQVLLDVEAERIRQIEKWGEQNWPMVQVKIMIDECIKQANEYKKFNDTEGGTDWVHILLKEVYEAFAETEPDKQREEMVQVATVVVQIIEYLDRKNQSAISKRQTGA